MKCLRCEENPAPGRVVICDACVAEIMSHPDIDTLMDEDVPFRFLLSFPHLEMRPDETAGLEVLRVEIRGYLANERPTD